MDVMDTDHDVIISREATAAARAALRWVTGAGISVDDGMTWPSTRAPGAPSSDDLYFGTAGVLTALAEARLGGLTEFDGHARAAAGRLIQIAWRAAREQVRICPKELEPEADEPDLSLYTGLAGVAAALAIWAQASGDTQADDAARALVAVIAAQASAERQRLRWHDVMSGQAGVLLVLVTPVALAAADGAARRAAAGLADGLLASARWIGGLPDWYPRRDLPVYQPNFSHGLAGISYALAAAGYALDRQDLVDVAASGARRLIQLGTQPDGTLAVPMSIPPSPDSLPAVAYGWCHGATGTLRLFELLDRLQPGAGWAAAAEGAREAVLRSGIPARLYPGFWDNLGQCCGTSGVGEMALDRYQQTGDKGWLAWAESLATDVMNRAICDTSDEPGVRWSHTEHRADPPELEPAVGYMQGTAGIASWLLRLCRVQRDGPAAERLSWPDRPDIR